MWVKFTCLLFQVHENYLSLSLLDSLQKRIAFLLLVTWIPFTLILFRLVTKL